MPDLSRYKLIVLDVDGTLRTTTIPGQPCPHAPGEWALLPNVAETIASLPNHLAIGLASNQAGISLQYLTYSMARRLIDDLCAELKIRVLPEAIQICPHAVDEGCICRKPMPGMLYAIMRAMGVHRRAEVLYVGDLESDAETARRAGVDFLSAAECFGWPQETPS